MPAAPAAAHSPFYRRLGPRLIGTAALVVTLSLVTMIGVTTERLRDDTYEHNVGEVRKVTESIRQNLQAVMLTGYANMAQMFASSLKSLPGVTDVHILRTDGNEAFLDNSTIHDVNERRGDEDFLPRRTESVNRVLPEDQPELLRLRDAGEILHYYETAADGTELLTFLAPINNDEDCHKCHGAHHKLRGVLRLTTSLEAVQDDLQRTRLQSLLVLLAAVATMIGVTAVLIRRAVVRPIQLVSSAMSEVARGNLVHDIPVTGHDEVAQMAGAFRQMTGELERNYRDLNSEQDKLATIIRTAREGIVVTNHDYRVVLVNPSAVEILGKSERRICDDGLLNLLDDPEAMLQWLEAEDLDAQHPVQWGERFLQVQVAMIHDADGRLIGATALLRDVTEEHLLDQELRMLSLVDGLTGLGNRRHLEQMLAHEFVRAQEIGTQLSVMMFDIDHFKRFNDTHGHDQGDRVLQAVAEAVREQVRRVDIACRYGGEEFLVILPGTNEDGAGLLAERVRARVEEMRVDGLAVTVSIGVASYEEIRPDLPEGLVEAADQALYRAKRGGRNRVVVAGHAEPEAGA